MEPLVLTIMPAHASLVLRVETDDVAGVQMLGLAMLTVGWQSVRAALADPVDSLRSE